MQKVVYLLKAAGCPYDADFYLHHYGPYSTDVAQLTDELVRLDLLEETERANPVGKQYSYSLPSEVLNSLHDFEQTQAGNAALQEMQPYEEIAKALLQEDVSRLEHAATIAYFKNQGWDWPDAVKRACEFKRLSPDGAAAKSALELARDVMAAS
jgi:uncharacterized protein YwgA